MENIISLGHINFKYKEKEIFKDFSISIKEGTYLNIIGLNGSGKSTLIRIIVGLLKSEGKVIIDNEELGYKTVKNIAKKIGMVFENPDNQFVGETVRADIAFSLENMCEKSSIIFEKVKEISEYVGITHLLDREPHKLSGGEKQLVALASALVIKPKILILDEALSMLDPDIKSHIYEILKEENEKGTTIINVTHDNEEVVNGSEIAVLHDGKLLLYGDKYEVLKEEKIFNTIGLSLPFMAELSIKLMYYELIDSIILDMDEMVNVLWK